MTETIHRQLAASFVVGLSALVCTLVLGAHVKAQDIGIKEIVAAMERRQEQVRSAKFVWRETRTYPKGSIVDPDTEATYPPEDTTVEWDVTFWLDGSKLNYTCEQELWTTDEGRFAPSKLVATSDGVCAKRLRISDSTGEAFGVIYDGAEHSELDTADLTPVLMSYRARHELYGSRRFTPAEWSVSPRREKVDGMECVVLQKKAGKGVTFYMAFAPEQDLSFVQYRIDSKSQLVLRTHITHRRDETAGWVPAGWDITFLDPQGRPDCLIRATVTDYSINPSIDPSTFDVEFPVGTVVLDLQKKEQYRVLDGGRREPLGAR